MAILRNQISCYFCARKQLIVNMEKKETWMFPRAFWVANTVELFERAAYYGVFIVITLYLSRIIGFGDIEAAAIAGTFSAILYLLPTFAGAYADKIGFRKSLMLAFGLLTLGYAGMGLLPTLFESAGLVEYGDKTVFHGVILFYFIVSICSRNRTRNRSFFSGVSRK